MLLRFRQLIAVAGASLLAAGVAACGNDEDETTAAVDTTTAVKALPSPCADVEYEGEGEPDALIASDLPMQGDSAERSEEMVEAIRLALDDADWRAGDTNVAFQACDDSIAKTGLWDAKTCRDNATAYAKDPDLIGVVGTYNSGCAAEIIPILNRAPGGPVPMVSPGNTLVDLTEKGKAAEDLYPTGERNYARVIPNDAFQGAALAELAERESNGTVVLLYAAHDPTSLGQANNFQGAAKKLGLKLRTLTWDPKADDYAALMKKVAKLDPGAVVLAGLTEQNAGQLISDKVDVVGSNEKVPLIGFDGLTQQSTIDKSDGAAKGMLSSIPGRAPQNLAPTGAEFADQLEERIGGGGPLEQFAPYAGEATEVLLQAIDEGGADRAKTSAALFGLEREDGLLGSYEIDAFGDPSEGPVTIFLAGDTFEPEDEITPPADLVAAAAQTP
ncbi:MAG TPA: branched-chain amino acid ABC transporter substrate-binding protein [Solirubrobacterales bacterium]|nr:branched-chain amino acid ABC transporter substrate-binding protein [Solirubrobacterales bacterium]